MAGVLPPWHDRCHGSPVWCGSLPLGRFRPPFGDRPHGSHKGQCPLTPHRAHRARGCSWDMRLGREITAARQRASRLAGLVRLPAAWQTQTAIRRQASWLAIKASVDLISRWPLALQKYPSYAEATHHARCAPAYRHPGKGRAAHSSPPQKFPRCTEAYHPARGAPASRQLRGSRAAIGSGGKKARPFWRRKKASSERAR